MDNPRSILLLVAIVCFVIKASGLHVEQDGRVLFGPIDWIAAGFAFVTAAVLFGG